MFVSGILPDGLAARSAEGAGTYQPGVKPQENEGRETGALKARSEGSDKVGATGDCRLKPAVRGQLFAPSPTGITRSARGRAADATIFLSLSALQGGADSVLECGSGPALPLCSRAESASGPAAPPHVKAVKESPHSKVGRVFRI